MAGEALTAEQAAVLLPVAQSLKSVVCSLAMAAAALETLLKEAEPPARPKLEIV